MSNDLVFIDEDSVENTIYLDDGRVVKSPGFEIYMLNIEEIDFYNKDNLIYMSIIRDDNKYNFLIGCDIDE